MLLALLLLHITALSLANPFHKYPYVFLLDVGNEELDKVNTEQIRISKEGGSLALRYPAIGNGEDIAHVRVSGIDFGTDLKANIVDGGPGYKYVVMVLMGNPGVAFDAVVTVQTVPGQNNDEASLQNVENGSSDTDYQVSEENDANDSAEDLSDSPESEEASQVSVTRENAELTQESSNIYSYAVNEALSGYGNSVHSNGYDEDAVGYNENESDDDEVSDNNKNENTDNEDDDEENSDLKDIHEPYKEDQIQVDDMNAQFDEYTNDGDSSSLIENQSQVMSNDDDYSVIDDQNYVPNVGHQEQVNANVYEEYQAFKHNLYNGGETYPQESRSEDSEITYVEEPGDNEGPFDFKDIFSEEYDDDDSSKYNNPNNNNFIDRNDRSAVAY